MYMIFQLLGVKPGHTADMQEFAKILYKLGVKKKNAEMAFYMIDRQHPAGSRRKIF